MIRLNIFGIGNKIQKQVWFSFLANLGVLKSILRNDFIKHKLQISEEWSLTRRWFSELKILLGQHWETNQPPWLVCKSRVCCFLFPIACLNYKL